MKTLTSFRLENKTKNDLKYLAKKHKTSEADIIAMMCEFVQQPSSEFDFDVAARSYKLQRSKSFRELTKDYDKLNAEEQKAMRQMILENFTTDDFT